MNLGNELLVGQVVYSKCGRDKRKPFIISKVDENYLYLIDGDLRTVEKPKKKKDKHVQITHHVIDEIACKLINNVLVKNSDFKKALEGFK